MTPASATLAAAIIGLCWLVLSAAAAIDALIERTRHVRRN